MDTVVAGVMAFALVLGETAIDIQIGESGQSILSGTPGHPGCGHERRDAGGRAAVDQPGDVEATIETGFGLADSHCWSLSRGNCKNCHGPGETALLQCEHADEGHEAASVTDEGQHADALDVPDETDLLHAHGGHAGSRANDQCAAAGTCAEGQQDRKSVV